MKLKLAGARKFKKDQGSALVISLLVVLVTIPLMMSYVASVQQEYRSVIRSQEWNSSLTMVEAGIEDAFGHLNNSCYSNEFNLGVLDWDKDRWALLDAAGKTTLFIPRRTITNTTSGITNGFYEVRIITNYPAYGISQKNPQIVCVGITPSPLVVASNGFAYRQVRVSTRLRAKFGLGMLAGEDIVGNGKFLMDAYNSQQWDQSFYGFYDWRYHVAQGTIGSINGHINLGSQGEVWGSGQTGNGSNQYLTNGTMGDMTWMTNGSSGIQTNAYTKDLNATIDAVQLPDTTWTPLVRCDCISTYVEPQQTAMTVTTIDFPNPLPPGPITTNISALGSTTNYPNPAPAAGVYTNIITISNLTSLPNPLPLHYFNVQTNYSSLVWNTNPATAYTSPPQMPTTYSTPPGLLTDHLVVSNYSTVPPPSNIIYGNSGWSYVYVSQKVKGVWTNVIDAQKNGNVWSTNYTFDWIKDYRYANATNTLSYSYFLYSYTNLSYTYETTNATQKTVQGKVAYSIGTGFWEVDSLDLQNDVAVVTGNAVLHVKGSLSIGGNNGKIVITPGSSLTIYAGGDVDVKGNGVANQGGNARDLTLYGLETCTSITFGGNAAWVGTVYAPNAFVHAGGGGNDSLDIRGAIVANSIKFNGKFSLHFDLSLMNNGPSDGFVGSSWIEETPGTLP